MKNNFKIATYNIWKNSGDFPNRIHKIGEYLKKLDCICFQEDYHDENFSSSDTINNSLKLQKFTLKIRKKNRAGILSSSNLTILTKITPTNVDSLIFDKDGEDERGALIVELKYNEKSILVLNTHLTNFDHKRRMEQIYTIKDYIDKQNADLILLCGDMNSIPRSKELECIKQHGFIDDNNNPTYEGGLILDYILSKSTFPIEIRSKIIVQKLSDHHCLQNKFIW